METDLLLSKKKGRMPGGLTAALFPDASRFIVGVFLLLVVVLLWTASNFITADLETGADSWNKPFLITYLNTSSFAIYLIPALIRYWRNGTFSREHDRTGYNPLPRDDEDAPTPQLVRRPSLSLTRSRSPSSPRVPLHQVQDSEIILSRTPQEVQTTTLPKLTVRETAEVAAWWSAVWFLANWSLNAALAWASVASVTILSSTSSFFTLTLGALFGVEDVTRAKVFSALACFMGVILVTRSDSTVHHDVETPSDLPSHPVLGDILSLLSSAFYSVYVILLKVRLGDESRADTQLMLGFAGLFNIVFLIPVFPILHYFGFETFEMPPTRMAWTICLINMFITLSSDYLYVLAMLKTTPMLVTIGLSLTIPMALIGSALWPSANTASITPLSLAGAALVVGSFVVLGWQGWADSQAEEASDEAHGGVRQPSRPSLDEGVREEGNVRYSA